MTTTAKVLFSGKTHTTSGPDGASRSSDGFLDVKLPQPHPAAEDLFASAWSACYLGAIELAAGRSASTWPSQYRTLTRRRWRKWTVCSVSLM